MARKAYAGDDKNIRQVRWQKILQLIDTSEIGTQQELVDLLNADGYDVTQATVSRDIKDLGLVKVASNSGGRKYQAQVSERAQGTQEKFRVLYKSQVTNIETALNQVVINCDIGSANLVCAAFDKMNFEGVMGTIAGDDTILVILKSEAFAKNLMRELSEI